MSYQLPEKLKNLSPYEPGPTHLPIRLDANESFIQPSPEIRKEILKIAEKFNFVRYPDALSAKVCGAFADFYGIDRDLVTAGDGSDELISILMNAFFNQGDKILMFSPDFSMYSIYCGICQLQPVVVQKDESFAVDIDKAIEIAKREKVSGVILSNPCNPTGQGISREEIRRFVGSVDALFVLDEAYMDFWDQSLMGEVEKYDRLIILRTCSKAIGLASMRLGFAVANKKLTRAYRAAKSPYNVNAMTQEIGALILSNKSEFEKNIALLKRSVSALYRGLKELGEQCSGIKVYPSYTNFVFVKTERSGELYKKLLEKGICVRDMNGYLRITCGKEEENTALLSAMKTLLA